MGECYSCQSRSGKQTYMYYASDMSLSSNPTPYSGVRRFSGPLTSKPRKSSPNNNARIRNSNEQLATDEERAALVTITNGPSTLASSNKSKSQPSMTHVGGGRFGFRPASAKARIPGADSNSNITATGVTTSTDSLDSYGPGKSKAAQRTAGLISRHQPAQRPTCMAIGDAYAPPQMARWRMIDDSDTGTLTSMSLSPSTPSDAMLKLLTGDSQRNLDTNGNNMNTESSSNINETGTGSLKQGKAHNERKPYSRIPNFGTSRVPSKLQRPSAASTVTTSSTSSGSVPEQQGQNENNKMKSQAKHKPRRFVGGWFSGKKSQSQDSKSSQLQKEKSQPQKESKNKTNLSKSNIQSKQTSKTEVKHLDSNLNEAEGSGEAMAEPEKDTAFKPKDVSKSKVDSKEIVIETEIISGPIQTSNIPDVDTKEIDREKDTPRKRTVSSESQGRSHVPLARQDSLDSNSICSLNSDDLMLDMDFDDPADQSLDRSALRQKLSRKASSEKRGRLFSTEDDFQEEDEEEVDGFNVSHPAVDKAVHAAVASQMQAAVPYTPSTPSVPSSPDVISSSTGGRDSEPISPLASDAAPKMPQKPQSLNLRQPVLGVRARSASSPTRIASTSNTSNPTTQTSKGAVPIQRRSVDSPRGLRQRVNSASEAVDELSTLTSQLSLNSPLNESHPIQRRPRLRTAGRPASFHGTASSLGDGDTSLPRPRTLRPPRQPSITDEDVEPVAIDGSTYRHMVQDLTTFKTNLLRLKRIIQEDEFSQASKNGYKLGGTSPAESPFGMSSEAARLWQGTVTGTAAAAPDRPDTSNVSLEDVMMENRELRVQLQFMQKQLEEHERTIKLLQQQMSKYNVKPRLAVSKGLTKPASDAAGAVEASPTRGGSTGGASVGSQQQQAAGGGAGTDPAVISSTTKIEKETKRKLNFTGKVNGNAEPVTRLPMGTATTGSRLRQPSRFKANGRPTNIHS